MTKPYNWLATNPRDILQLVRAAAEGWNRIELEEVELDDGVVHAELDLACEEGEEEPDENAVALWVIRVLNALAQTPTAQLPFRGRGWGRRGQPPPPLSLDPRHEGIVVESVSGGVFISIALELNDPDTPRIVWALSDLDVAKLEKGLERFCISTKAKGETAPSPGRYVKPSPKPVTVPASPPVRPHRRKAAKKRVPRKKTAAKKRPKKTTPRKAVKRTPPLKIDLIELAKKARGNPDELQAIKERMLSLNPKHYQFWASCPQLPGELVQYLTDCDRAVRITYSAFARNADLEPFQQDKHPAMYRISMPDNWSISFWKSTLPSGMVVYYFDWSRIEHFFVPQAVDLEREMALMPTEANPLPALPVVKRRLYPHLILGQVGMEAYYKYRGWDFQVRRTKQARLWDVIVVPPPGVPGEAQYFTSTTYDGAVCVGKIEIDLMMAIREIQPQSDSYHLIYFWQQIYRFAKDYMTSHGRVTRAKVARRMEEERQRRRRHRISEAPMAHDWWDSLPLKQRLQLIDDRLEYAYCMHGNDWRDWPDA